MSDTLKDSHGAEVTVDLDEAGQAYVIRVDSGQVAGRAHFIAGPDATERIFYHTVIDEEFSGRGLSSTLVAQALTDSRQKGITVVPVCPLFVKKLQQTGDDYRSEGGQFRNATTTDFDLVKRNA
ncbi:N-acetyltransferase [Brevibacterium permense]|uniref:GNAT family N-acetyltransferase n=1 Tax=Brevibacterium permense TaxID=234834 RepID=UPI0021CE5100|nr:GNAT family N-acetyltransferase [Brevibacterium permense]MCU4298793.1 N-acetyltransferase [Brevibacterium permense]